MKDPANNTSNRHPPVRRREIFGWAMFDFANSSFTTVIVTVGYAIFFTKVVAGGERGEVLWATGIFITNLAVIITAPILGAVADDSGRKKTFLAATYLLCVAGTASLYFVVPGAVLLGVILFAVSSYAYASGEALAGAFLPEISTPENIGRISGFGWGLGYFGGLGCLMLVQPLLVGGFDLDNLANLRLAWVATAGFFLVAALPTFLFLRERAVRPARRPFVHYVSVGFRRFATTLRSVRHFSQLIIFLAVFFVYSCGLVTVITFAGIYAENTLAYTSAELVVLFMIVQISSAGGAIGFGWVQDRIGARRLIQLTLVLWIVALVSAYTIPTKGFFFAVALAAGLGIGSLQSASRAMVGLFSPQEKTGEFFGLWGQAGRAAYLVGPMTFGVMATAADQQTAILSTGGFFLLGLLGMLLVNEHKGRAAAESWQEESAAEREAAAAT